MSEESMRPEDDGEIVSRSQVKREMLALQALGERLMELGPEQWPGLGLGPLLLEALEESRRIKSHNARRRHIRRLGKLLRNEETERVEALFRRMDKARLEDTHRFHRLEAWRERLLAEGDDALEALLLEAPGADRQRLRQLIRDGRRERESGRPPSNQRKLFKYLRELGLD